MVARKHVRYGSCSRRRALAVRELLKDRATVKRAREPGPRVPLLAEECRSVRGMGVPARRRR